MRHGRGSMQPKLQASPHDLSQQTHVVWTNATYDFESVSLGLRYDFSYTAIDLTDDFHRSVENPECIFEIGERPRSTAFGLRRRRSKDPYAGPPDQSQARSSSPATMAKVAPDSPAPRTVGASPAVAGGRSSNHSSPSK